MLHSAGMEIINKIKITIIWHTMSIMTHNCNNIYTVLDEYKNNAFFKSAKCDFHN